MIRVLHVIDHLDLGGAQSALLDLVRGRDPQRVHAEVAVVHGRGLFAGALEDAGARVHTLAAHKWSPLHAVRFLKLAGSGRHDILHFHLQGANWLLKPLAALACDLPRVAHDHTSGDLHFRGLLSVLPDALSHCFSHRVLAVSAGIRDFLAGWEAVPGDAICVVPNGVDTTSFRPADSVERMAARNALGLDEHTFAIGAMGRLSPEKNFGILPALAEELPGACFLLGGDGPLWGELSAAFPRSPAWQRLRLLGRVSDRMAFYHALDAFVLPSLHEGLPMVLLEAMASGLPVVASRLPDVEAALGEPPVGRLADPSSPGGFVAGLAGLAASPAARAALGAAARRRCEDRFGARRCAQAVEAVYVELAECGACGSIGARHEA